jgi:hypothetical protein
LVDDDTALQYCSYTGRPCAHGGDVLFLSVGVFGPRRLLIFQKDVLLWLEDGAAGMDVPVYPFNNRPYKFRVVDRSVSFQAGDQMSSRHSIVLAGGQERAPDMRRRRQSRWQCGARPERVSCWLFVNFQTLVQDRVIDMLVAARKLGPVLSPPPSVWKREIGTGEVYRRKSFHDSMRMWCRNVLFQVTHAFMA